MKSKIVLFYQHMPPFSGAGAHRGLSVTEGLARLNDLHCPRVIVYTSTPIPTAINQVQIVSLSKIEIDNSLPLSSRVLGEAILGIKAACRMLLARRTTTCAIVSSPAYLSALIVSLAITAAGVPYVLDVRDLYPQVYSQAGLLRNTSLSYRIFLRASRLMYNRAIVVITATKGLQREILIASPRSKTQTVYNGYPSHLQSRIQEKRRKFTVCFHGVLGFFQDIETLVELAVRLSIEDVDVLVIGYGRKQDILKRSSSDNLHYLGKLTFEETITEIQSCHVGLCLRLDDEISRDAFPVKVWEYIGLGVPSIVTPHCEAGDFLVQNGCGFQLNAGDVEAIANAIIRLKTHPQLMRSIETRCRSVARSYTRERMGDSAANVICNVIQASAGNKVRTV